MRCCSGVHFVERGSAVSEECFKWSEKTQDLAVKLTLSYSLFSTTHRVDVPLVFLIRCDEARLKQRPFASKLAKERSALPG